MDNTLLITLLTIILPLFGAGVGYLVKHSIDKKKELASEVNKARRDLYQDFVNLIVDIFVATKLKDKNKNSTNQEKNLQKIYEFYKVYILYASPKVINAFADYFQMLYKGREATSTKDQLLLLTNIMAEMRKDLGLKNNNLGRNGGNLMRAIITDFDSI